MKKGTYKLNSGSGKTERHGASPSFSHAGAEKMRSLAWAAGVTAFLFVLLSLRWDFYFDLNDDVCMKDILSGIYRSALSSLCCIGCLQVLTYTEPPFCFCRRLVLH